MTSNGDRPPRYDANGHKWRVARRRAIRDSTGTCAICGERIDPDLAWPHPGSLSIDHRTPISKGGALFSQENLTTVHLRCNQSKGSRVDEPRPDPTGCDTITHSSRDWLSGNLEPCPLGNGYHQAR